MPQPFRRPVHTAWRVDGLLEHVRNTQRRLKSLLLLGILVTFLYRDEFKSVRLRSLAFFVISIEILESFQAFLLTACLLLS